MSIEVLTNNTQQYVYNKLSNLLKNDDISEVTFMVAFLTVDGVYLILEELQELLAQKVKIVIITGLMNNFNSPKVFELLLRIEKLEVRIANIFGYHPKLYRFKYNSGKSCYIIGSSNLTNNALRRNLEVNTYIEQLADSSTTQQVEEIYQQVYADSQPLTHHLIQNYCLSYVPNISAPKQITPIKPNSMQLKALASLSQLRKSGQTKALIISATGSGKTYLSAFDAKTFNAKKLLFIAHRDNILNTSIISYRNIIKKLNTGKLTGETKDFSSNYIFASIQTLSKDEHLLRFKPSHFDYIIIDEVHRAGAASYRKVINYFKPEFLLGMSATPERNDDFDIYPMFDHNIAHEIRLNEALEAELVCPFHYFGISELIVGNNYLSDYSNLNKIEFKQRVSHIIQNLKLYGHDGNKVKGLIFASRIEEAQNLSAAFNQLGFKTLCLSGNNSDADRETAIELLSNDYTDGKGNPQDYLDYIFSVDIFNEGIDIPHVNQIVMLRPTQSAIIFTQQLGRGLRKSPHKEYCVIIDFIGNYTGNFLIAIALSGNNSYDKESLRRFVREANSMIPGYATVSFDKISRERIYASINDIFINKKFIDQKYTELKRKLNHPPTLLDFKQYNSIDPKIIFKYSAKASKVIYNNYSELLSKYNDIPYPFTDEQELYLNYITQELLFAARPDEIFVLHEILNGNNNPVVIYTKLQQRYNTLVTEQKKIAILKILTLETSAALLKKYKLAILNNNLKTLYFTDNFKINLEYPHFRQLVSETLELGLSYFEDYKHATRYHDFVLYNKYSRKEVTRLLNVNLSLETSIYGYRIIKNTVPIFVTYHKSTHIAANAKYENIFLNNHDLIWYSRPATQIGNKEIQNIIDYKKNNLTIMIFLKKSDNEGSEHYYLGNADIHDYVQESFNHTTAVKFILRLQIALPDADFDYLTN